MDNWKNINISSVSKVEKLEAEFQIWELKVIPSGKFKVRIYQRSNNKLIGYTNIKVKDPSNDFFDCGVGFGATISEALEDTIKNFFNMLNNYNPSLETDFEWMDPSDF